MDWRREKFRSTRSTATVDSSVTRAVILVARMFTRVALVCACALVASIFAVPAPPRRDKDSNKMVPERTIVVRRVPNAYVYPFSLWPIPRYPVREEQTVEYTYNGKTVRRHSDWNKR